MLQLCHLPIYHLLSHHLWLCWYITLYFHHKEHICITILCCSPNVAKYTIHTTVMSWQSWFICIFHYCNGHCCLQFYLLDSIPFFCYAKKFHEVYNAGLLLINNLHWFLSYFWWMISVGCLLSLLCYVYRLASLKWYYWFYMKSHDCCLKLFAFILGHEMAISEIPRWIGYHVKTWKYALIL